MDKFGKELENKQITINESLDKNKEILQTLREKQSLVRDDLLTAIPGTRKHNELVNFKKTVARLLEESEEIQDQLVRKRVALNRLVHEYTSDFLSDLSSGEGIAVQQNAANYAHRLATLELEEEDMDTYLALINSSDTSLPGSSTSRSTESTDTTRPQTQADSLSDLFSNLTISDNCGGEDQASCSFPLASPSSSFSAHGEDLPVDSCPLPSPLSSFSADGDYHPGPPLYIPRPSSSSAHGEDHLGDSCPLPSPLSSISANEDHPGRPLYLPGPSSSSADGEDHPGRRLRPLRLPRPSSSSSDGEDHPGRPLRLPRPFPTFPADGEDHAGCPLRLPRPFPSFPADGEQPGPSGLQRPLARSSPVSFLEDNDSAAYTSYENMMLPSQPRQDLFRTRSNLQIETNAALAHQIPVRCATSETSLSGEPRFGGVTALEDTRNRRPLFPFPQSCFISEQGTIVMRFRGNILLELTPDFGIHLSYLPSGISIGVASTNARLGIIHPKGRLYQRDRDLQVQIRNKFNFERMARITNDDNLMVSHNKSDLILELTDLGPMMIETMTVFDITSDQFTHDLMLSEGRHGPAVTGACVRILDDAKKYHLQLYDRMIIGCIRIIQMPNGSLSLYKNENELRLQITPETGSCRINTKNYRVKTDSRENFVNFFLQQDFNRIVSHKERFIIRRKEKSCGFDKNNTFRGTFRRVRNEPRYENED